MAKSIPWDEAKGRVHRVLNRLAAMHIPDGPFVQLGGGPFCLECKHGWPCQSRERIDEMRRLLPNVQPPPNGSSAEVRRRHVDLILERNPELAADLGTVDDG